MSNGLASFRTDVSRRSVSRSKMPPQGDSDVEPDDAEDVALKAEDYAYKGLISV